MAVSQASMKLIKIVERFELEILNAGKNYERCLIREDDINRPALQILGFFDYFNPNRIQVLGKVEWTYLNTQPAEERRKCFEAFFQKPIPAMILTRGLEPFPELMEMALKYKRTILRSKEATSIFIPLITNHLKATLSPKTTRHGVLMDISGEGVLIMGESGVGKSETAVELIKRGHRLVADDAVEIRHIGPMLVGSAPELIRHYIELRGIGIVDVRQLFGMSAIKEDKEVDLIVKLEPWNENAFYDRMGTNEEYTTILDMKVPVITIPVKPGRNLAVIVEVAAMNNRQKRMGFNAAKEFARQLDEHFEEMMRQSQMETAEDYDEYDDLSYEED